MTRAIAAAASGLLAALSLVAAGCGDEQPADPGQPETASTVADQPNTASGGRAAFDEQMRAELAKSLSPTEADCVVAKLEPYSLTELDQRANELILQFVRDCEAGDTGSGAAPDPTPGSDLAGKEFIIARIIDGLTQPPNAFPPEEADCVEAKLRGLSLSVLDHLPNRTIVKFVRACV